MSYNFYSEGYIWVIYIWSLFAISTPFVVIRLFIQIRYIYRPWREIWVILAWVFFLGACICSSLWNDWDGDNYSVDWDAKTDAELAPAMKVQWVLGLMWMPLLCSCKAALLCFYQELAPKHVFPKIWWTIRITWVLTFALFTLRPISAVISCKPIESAWLYSQVQNCFYHDIWWWRTAEATFHILTDLIVYLLPIAILRQLENLSRKQKRQALGMFFLGFLNIIAAVQWSVYICSINIDDPTWNHIEGFFFYFQVASAIVIICLPYCRRFHVLRKQQRANSDASAEMAHHALSKTVTGGTVVLVKSGDVAVDLEKADSRVSVSVQTV